MGDQALSAGSLVGLGFSHYYIIEEIGGGGVGVGFRTRDQDVDREVAINVPVREPSPMKQVTNIFAEKHGPSQN